MPEFLHDDWRICALTRVFTYGIQGVTTKMLPTIETWTEHIVCPQCATEQDAVVENHNDEPWARYIFTCTHCGYLIMESKWSEQ